MGEGKNSRKDQGRLPKDGCSLKACKEERMESSRPRPLVLSSPRLCSSAMDSENALSILQAVPSPSCSLDSWDRNLPPTTSLPPSDHLRHFYTFIILIYFYNPCQHPRKALRHQNLSRITAAIVKFRKS